MTIVVLLLLAVVWIAVLAPPVIRRRAETQGKDSVGAFHRQLRVLQRAGPQTIVPAHRRLAPPPAAGAADAVRAVPIGPSRSAHRVLPSAARHRTLRRRRDVLAALAGSTGGFLLLGLVPHLHVLLGGALLAAALCGGYVVLLVRIRNAAAERAAKLRYLPSAPARSFGGLRQSAN